MPTTQEDTKTYALAQESQNHSSVKDHPNPERHHAAISREDLKSFITDEIMVMARFAFSSGKAVAINLQKFTESDNLDELCEVHAKLSTIVYPAIPDTIRYSNKVLASKHRNRLLVVHPLVKQQLFLASVGLLTFILTGITEHVNEKTVDTYIENNEGLPALIVFLFLSSLALLGVVFSKFKAVITSIKNRSASGEDSTYINLLSIVGLISGITFSVVLNVEGFGYDNLLLAFFGGFSTETLRHVLVSVETQIKSIFKANDNKEQKPLKN